MRTVGKVVLADDRLGRNSAATRRSAQNFLARPGRGGRPQLPPDGSEGRQTPFLGVPLLADLLFDRQAAVGRRTLDVSFRGSIFVHFVYQMVDRGLVAVVFVRLVLILRGVCHSRSRDDLSRSVSSVTGYRQERFRSDEYRRFYLRRPRPGGQALATTGGSRQPEQSLFPVSIPTGRGIGCRCGGPKFRVCRTPPPSPSSGRCGDWIPASIVNSAQRPVG